MSERHDAGRIDRQLAGRCGRQGEAGRFEAYLSLDDALLEMDGNRTLAALARFLMPVVGHWLGRLVMRDAQRRAEALHAWMRHDLLMSDEALGDRMAFSGRGE
jgi:preprotein translocase subunit SecA